MPTVSIQSSTPAAWSPRVEPVPRVFPEAPAERAAQVRTLISTAAPAALIPQAVERPVAAELAVHSASAATVVTAMVLVAIRGRAVAAATAVEVSARIPMAAAPVTAVTIG